MTTINCWLWQETDDSLRWWTPENTQVIDASLPSEGHLPQFLAEELSEYLRNSSVRLHLAKNVPDNWQRLPWENVPGDLLVSRYAQYAATPPRLPIAPTAVLLNFWESDDFCDGFFSDATETIYGYAAQEFAETENLSAKSLLCVISHGTEQGNEKPFRIAEEQTWALPLNRGLPPLVILLACGNNKGNLLDYGQTLLEHGAQTVLAPLGQLNAKHAADFLGTFLDGWQQGTCVDELLADSQGKIDGFHGAQRLHLLGYGKLRVTREPLPAELVDTELNARARQALRKTDDSSRAFVQALLERLTLYGYQEKWGEYWVEKVMLALFERLQLERSNEADETVLLGALKHCEAELSLLTRVWILPLMVYLAEYYENSLLAYCQKAHYKLPTTVLPNAAGLYQQWSKLHHREGCYPLAVQKLAQGFDAAQSNTLAKQSLLGSLGNILFDFALPSLAEPVIDQISHSLKVNDAPDSGRQRFNLLDRQGHLALRQYQLEKAICFYERKHQKALQKGEDGHRELAWLLYASVWAGSYEASDYAHQARAALPDVADIEEVVNKGNPNTAYLLRALALWSWREGDAEIAKLLLDYVPFINRRLPSQDPGPFAFAIAYLQLYQRDHASLGKKIPSWARAEAMLESQGYWLELAAFHAFFGEIEAAQRCLGHFQSIRGEAVDNLMKIAACLDASSDWRAEIEVQTARENAVLLDVPTVEGILQTGLLPL